EHRDDRHDDMTKESEGDPGGGVHRTGRDQEHHDRRSETVSDPTSADWFHARHGDHLRKAECRPGARRAVVVARMRSRAKEAPMWVVAGVLVGLVVLASLVGFHTGPHGHVVASLLGVAAA